MNSLITTLRVNFKRLKTDLNIPDIPISANPRSNKLLNTQKQVRFVLRTLLLNPSKKAGESINPNKSKTNLSNRNSFTIPKTMTIDKTTLYTVDPRLIGKIITQTTLTSKILSKETNLKIVKPRLKEKKPQKRTIHLSITFPMQQVTRL